MSCYILVLSAGISAEPVIVMPCNYYTISGYLACANLTDGRV